jgi:hypothetical protein
MLTNLLVGFDLQQMWGLYVLQPWEKLPFHLFPMHFVTSLLFHSFDVGLVHTQLHQSAPVCFISYSIFLTNLLADFDLLQMWHLPTLRCEPNGFASNF